MSPAAHSAPATVDARVRHAICESSLGVLCGFAVSHPSAADGGCGQTPRCGKGPVPPGRGHALKTREKRRSCKTRAVPSRLHCTVLRYAESAPALSDGREPCCARLATLRVPDGTAAANHAAGAARRRGVAAARVRADACSRLGSAAAAPFASAAVAFGRVRMPRRSREPRARPHAGASGQHALPYQSKPPARTAAYRSTLGGSATSCRPLRRSNGGASCKPAPSFARAARRRRQAAVALPYAPRPLVAGRRSPKARHLARPNPARPLSSKCPSPQNLTTLCALRVRQACPRRRRESSAAARAAARSRARRRRAPVRQARCRVSWSRL